MSCDHLICAYCAGPVEEGRCPSCRAARAHLHSHGFTPQQMMIGLALLLILLFSIAAPHLN